MDDGSQTRDRIIGAALRLLGEDGPDAFSAAALARETGVSKANVFHHFPRTDEIPLAALELLAQQVTARSVSPDRTALEPWLRAFGSDVFDTVVTNRAFLNAYFVFHSKALFDERLRPPLKRCAEHTRSVIEARMRLDSDREEVGALAALATTVLDGLVLHLLALDDRPAAEDLWSRFVDLLAARSRS